MLTELEQRANDEARHGNREALERLEAELANVVDVDLIEQAISDVLSEGGTYRDAAEYVARTLAAQENDG